METLLSAAAVFAWQLNGNIPFVLHVIPYNAPPFFPLYPLIDIYRPPSAIFKAQSRGQLLYKAQLQLKVCEIIDLSGQLDCLL